MKAQNDHFEKQHERRQGDVWGTAMFVRSSSCINEAEFFSPYDIWFFEPVLQQCPGTQEPEPDLCQSKRAQLGHWQAVL